MKLAVGLRLAVIVLLSACSVPAPSPPVAPPEGLVWPAPPARPRIRYVRTLTRPEDLAPDRSWLGRVWDVIAGREPVQLQRPYGVAVDREGRLYVADSASHVVHVFDIDARKYSAIKSMGRRPLVMPIGVATAPDGTVYVSDADVRAVGVFGRDGKFRRELPGGLARPTGIAVSPTGDRVYVVDTLAHHVAVFDAAGARVGTIGRRGTGAGDFNFPTNVAVDGNGLLYVTDTMNFEVKVFGANGRSLGRFGHHGDGSGDLARPKGLGTDSEGHVYVIEGLHDVIQIFDRDGAFLLAFGGTGHAAGRFWLPTGLHVDSRDRIYVADTYNGRVQIFQYVRETP